MRAPDPEAVLLPGVPTDRRTKARLLALCEKERARDPFSGRGRLTGLLRWLMLDALARAEAIEAAREAAADDAPAESTSRAAARAESTPAHGPDPPGKRPSRG